MLRYAFVVCLSSCVLVSCASKPLGELPKGHEERRQEDFGKLFGPELLVFGKPKNMQYGEGVAVGGAMRVNPYLWRATLDTLSFMPLASADATGGIILTDWYTNPSKPQERIKVTARIQDRSLRADALNISLYKQVLRNGHWITMTADDTVNHQIEDIILAKARDLKITDKQSAK